MSVNWVSTFVSFSSWVIYIPIHCRYPLIGYWHPSLGKASATCSLPHPENERQQSVNDFHLHIFGNLCSNWLQTSINQILAAFTGKNYSDMLPAASWKWASMECQQLQLLHIWLWRHRADLCVHNGIIDRPHRQRYNISKVKHQFQINRYCKLQSMQKHIICCWKRDFDKILLTNSKDKGLIWIYGWTRWATRRQPAQLRQVRSLPSNRTRVDGSGLFTTRTPNWAMVLVWTLTRTRSDGPDLLLTLVEGPMSLIQWDSHELQSGGICIIQHITR